MRSGGQRPTFERIGEYASTKGPDAVEMFEAYGREYYGSQKYEMDIFFARDERGGFAGKSIGITKPRQNGKSFAARDYALWMCFVEGKDVLFSAHHGRTVRKMFKEMCDFINAHEDFRDELESIYKAGGYEGIYTRSGHCVEFQTRTNSGGRGGTYSILLFDESQELTSLQQEAILPAASAASELRNGDGEPQKIYIGTVPGPGTDGDVFKSMHDRAHSGDSSVWWLEWGAQGSNIDDLDLDDVDLWYACNPAMGRRMSESTVRDERDTMTKEGFARERLGWWQSGKQSAVIPASRWAQCATDDPPMDGITCFSVKFSPNGQMLAVCAAIRGREADSKPHFELVHHKDTNSGVSWLVEWLSARKDTTALFVVDGLGSAENLRDRMRADGRVQKTKIHIPRPFEVATANAAFLDAIKSGAVTYHKDQRMDEAASGCTRRRIGTNGGWGFQSAENADATILEAAALALWAVITTKKDPSRKARIG